MQGMAQYPNLHIAVHGAAQIFDGSWASIAIRAVVRRIYIKSILSQLKRQ